MNVQVVGCSHHSTPVDVRERLAFSLEQSRSALDVFRRQFPNAEAVLLLTCNRVELYTASENGHGPTPLEIAEFLARFHDVELEQIRPHLYDRSGEAAVRHLFMVASSLDSMVVGEAQILGQVKQAYQLASQREIAGPVIHAAFQAALKTARRVAAETTIQQRRISIPSVAVADFAQQIFERFDDKHTLLIGAGEMAEETLRYLKAQGAREVTVINRSPDRAVELAARWGGRARAWADLLQALGVADLVISTTGSGEPIVTLAQFLAVEPARESRTLFILDLAVPRDFDPAIGQRPEVYLYSVDDLRQMCEKNRQERDKEMPHAIRIVEAETDRLMGDLHHRATGPMIQRLQQGWEKRRDEELSRLFHKLSELDDHSRDEIRQAFDRLLKKLLHPPLESLRNAARQGFPSTLLDALARLFQLKD